jgi:uncharacterized membrane protein YphA (DoxX/SURF4 family)
MAFRRPSAGSADRVGIARSRFGRARKIITPCVVVALLLVTELAVCLALLFGFLTRLAALAVVFIMGGILIFVHEGSTFEAVEFPILLIAAGLSLMITGGGHFSVDRAISVNLLPQVG